MSRKIGAALMDMRRLAESRGLESISSDDVATTALGPRLSVTTAETERLSGGMESARWRMISVRWIDETPEASRYARKRGSPMPERLEASLNAMQYGLAEWSDREMPGGVKAGKTFMASGYDAHIEKMVQGWSEENHRDMTDFLRKGGYAARRDSLMALRREDEVMTIDGSDEELRVLENGGVPSSSERSASRAGEDDGSTVEEAVQYGNPWAGSW